MRAVAIKKGQTREKAAGLREMGKLRCDSYAEEFVIGHQPTLADKRIAGNQARWLEKSWRKSMSEIRSIPTESSCQP
jgi:hypothetical protein